ncbi:HAD-IA family hydrolase [Cyanobium sp. ATX 6A2]|uniref:HAD-IA family hydrolase n=1 Tax=Cyanobium sp. ATX 6A2 TaxID=2823700 RepID=UPI0020CF732C|nr:HAD-IA family hydrolase [Cyanobium sp. ATX 6A2]MCP9887381.1 HAD-IA family hydrolase [Cyanobium sp. ATX 6A2]
MALRALLWDVDGTLAETERDGHRLAFNRAFAEQGVPLHWDAQSYGTWLAIAGGRERIRAALRDLQGREPDPAWVESLQACKQGHYAALMAAGGLGLRPGVAALIGAAAAAGLRQAIVTTSGRAAVQALAERLLGDLAGAFELWVCGDDVSRKKPDPEAYVLALQRLVLAPADALAIEDSPAGLAAAAAAGVPCVLTLSHYGRAEPLARFAAARAVLTGLGADGRVLRGPACPQGRFTLSYLQTLP